MKKTGTARQQNFQGAAINQDHSELSFNHFLTIIFRLSVVFFDANYKNSGNAASNIVENYKKLLSLLARVELTQGFTDFLGQMRINAKSVGLKVSSQTIQSLTPPKALLVQLYLNQQVFSSQAELEYTRDVHLEHECDSYNICKKLMEGMDKCHDTKQREVQQQIIEKARQDELEVYLEQVSDILHKIFRQYCSYGDPLNTDRLKSLKLVKMFQDLDLIEENKNNITSPNKKQSPPRQQSQAGNKTQKVKQAMVVKIDQE